MNPTPTANDKPRSHPVGRNFRVSTPTVGADSISARFAAARGSTGGYGIRPYRRRQGPATKREAATPALAQPLYTHWRRLSSTITRNGNLEKNDKKSAARKQSENQNRLCPYGRADRPVEQAVFFALNDGIDKAIYCQDKGQF